MSQRKVLRKLFPWFASHFEPSASQNIEGNEMIDWKTITTATLAYLLRHLSNPAHPKINQQANNRFTNGCERGILNQNHG